jgi:hypothetical protein
MKAKVNTKNNTVVFTEVYNESMTSSIEECINRVEGCVKQSLNNGTKIIISLISQESLKSFINQYNSL